jgi:hypothetical protein
MSAWEPALPLLESFAARLRAGSRIYCADEQAARWLAPRGFELEMRDPGKDMRFLQLPKASLSGVWAGNALAGYPIEETQRVIATFFQALEPRTGILFAAHHFGRDAFASMIRQNGFRALEEASRDGWFTVLAQRI